MKQLTVVATVFMLSFIVGLFGATSSSCRSAIRLVRGLFCLMFVSIGGILVYTWRRT
jgi:hypothetical protein